MKNDYSTVDDGTNYRMIASIMSKNGHQMNHSSVRNYIIRIMKKFVNNYTVNNNIQLTDEDGERIAKSSLFQKGISEALHSIEHEELKGLGVDVKRSS